MSSAINEKSQFMSGRFYLFFLLLTVFFIVALMAYSGFIDGNTTKNALTSYHDKKNREEYSGWEKGKRALAHAIEIDTIEVYQDFIDANPDNVWQKNFIYYRDRVEFRKARATNTIEAFQEFIEKRPDSVWIQQAVYYQSKVSDKNELLGGSLSMDERMYVDYRAAIIKSFDISSIVLKKGADVKKIELHNRSNIYTGPGAKVEHLDLYNNAVALIEGGDEIGYLSLYDQSSAEIIFIEALAWLMVSPESKVFVLGCDTSFSNGVLHGMWQKKEKPFSLRLVSLQDGTSGWEEFQELPDNVTFTDCNN